MERYARVADGKVAEVFVLPDVDVRMPVRHPVTQALVLDERGEFTFEHRKAGLHDFFPRSAEHVWVECPPEVQPGWSYNDQGFEAPEEVAPPPPVSWEQKLRKFLADNPDVREGLGA